MSNLMPKQAMAQRMLTLLDELAEQSALQTIDDSVPRKEGHQAFIPNGTLAPPLGELGLPSPLGECVFILSNQTEQKGRSKFEDAELEIFIKLCGERMVKTYMNGNRQEAVGWEQAMKRAIDQRPQVHQARMTADIARAINDGLYAQAAARAKFQESGEASE